MSHQVSAESRKGRCSVLRLSLFGALALAVVAMGNTGCEDKAIGRPCDVLINGAPDPSTAASNTQALECPTRICILPSEGGNNVPSPGKPATGALCSAECSQDSDCDGQTRDFGNANDTRCKTGFICGIPISLGPICCKKLCVCKDFVPSTGLGIPPACQGSAALTCYKP